MAWKRRSSMKRLTASVTRGLRSTARSAGRVVDVMAFAGRVVRNSLGRVVDELVYTVAPEAGIRRKVLRSIMEASEGRMAQMSRDDDDDRRGGDRLHGSQRWLSSRLSPDSQLESDLESERMHAVELYRDTTFGGAIDSWVDHVIGKGFTFQAKIKKQAGISKDAAEMWNSELEAVYARWSRSCDITGQESLWQLSRLAARSYKYAGEAFTVMWAKRRPGQPIPLVLEVVDVERVCTPPKKSGDPFCRMGIQYAPDGSGEIIGYWLRTTNPYDTKQVAYDWDFIPAAQMLHVYEKWFPGQSRGYPWMKRASGRIRDGEDLDEAGIIAAQVEACNAAFVKTKSPLKKAQGMGVATSSGLRLEDILPGKIQYLDSDSEEVLFNNPTKSNIVGTLHEWNHRRIAAGINWPYELLMRDWRGISFAGGRLILHGAKISCGCEQQLFTVAWFTCIWDEMVKQAVLFSETSGVTINVSKFQQRPWVYQAHQCTAPMWSYAITPGEEIEADIKAVANNMKTLEQVAGERSGNLEDVLAQRKIERDMERELDIEPPDRVAAIAQQGQQPDSPQGKEMKSAA